MDICNAMDEKLKNIDAFNGKLKIYEGVVKVMTIKRLTKLTLL